MEGQVDRDFFAAQLAIQKKGLAAGFGVTPEMLDGGGLHIMPSEKVSEDGFAGSGDNLRPWRGTVRQRTLPLSGPG